MQLCLNTSTVGPRPLLDMIALARQARYSAIELWHADVEDWLAQGNTLGELRARLNEAGLCVPSMISLKGWCESEGSERVAVWDQCRRRFDLARELGCPLCVAGPPRDTPSSQAAALAQAVDRYGDLLALGRAHGVRPALEFLGFAPWLCTLELAGQIALATGDADACVVLDPFHLFRGGSGIEGFECTRLCDRQIGILHCNDVPATPPRDRLTDADRVLPFDGVFPLRRYVAAARAAGYQGVLSLELFPRPPITDPLQLAREGRDRMLRLLETVG